MAEEKTLSECAQGLCDQADALQAETDDRPWSVVGLVRGFLGIVRGALVTLVALADEVRELRETIDYLRGKSPKT